MIETGLTYQVPSKEFGVLQIKGIIMPKNNHSNYRKTELQNKRSR